ncbi:g9062 [Coccomyxa elongata]
MGYIQRGTTAFFILGIVCPFSVLTRQQEQITDTGLQLLGRNLLERELPNGTFTVFSALHDPLSGEARVYAEVHPDTVCFSVAACQFSVKGGNKETVRVQARPEVPFAALSEKPQLRECFIFCTLPAPGSELEEVVIEGKDGQMLATWPVEAVERLPVGHKKGVGMCVGPIFSETPTFLDWLQYYADLGVDGIHMYAAVAEFILHRDDYMHAPGSRRTVQFQSHHLVTWRAFHPSRWSQHYYGQWLIFNDCVFRTRNIYDYIMFHDRDEFVHFVGFDKPRQVQLKHFFEQHFGAPDVASVVYWGGLYRLHCHMIKVSKIGTGGAARGEVDYQAYQGYNVWAADPRTPNFTGCDWISCHPKSVVRPLGVEIMGVHHAGRVSEGFVQGEPKVLPPEVIFIKHLRCLIRVNTSDWETDLSKPLCLVEDIEKPDTRFGGVPVCPAHEIEEVRSGKRTSELPA